MTTGGRGRTKGGSEVFDPLGPLPEHRSAIEASAGTGKTHALATLATRFVAEAGVAPSELLVVTFTRAAANELRAKVRQRLVETVDRMESASPSPDDDLDGLAAFLARDDAEARCRRLRQAVTEFDAATVTTIHGFAFQVRAALGAGSGVDAGDRLLPDNLPLLRAAATDVLAAASVGSSSADDLPDLDSLVRLADQLDGRPDLVTFPAPDDPAAPDNLAFLGGLVADTIELAGRRRRAARTVSFDDILTRFRSVLTDSAVGRGATRYLASRYRAVLIDEFQDTDPVQWDIFSTLFGGTEQAEGPSRLVLVGDPKQSIYGFRGADVHTYRRAVGDPHTTRRVLATNWRSDGALLESLASLFTGVSFGEGFEFHPVLAAGGHEGRRALDPDGRPLPALSLRLAIGPGIAHQKNSPQFVLVTAAREAILADLAGQLRGLLEDATIPDERGTDLRPVRPGDVAVLVPRHQDALDVQAALAGVRIPAVVTRAGSALESEAASQLRWLLHAME
ncbi:MAG: UvrD-helicase domain-containing protein, partial [Acidimicrobiales bacterium]|nr:UvrD-helicase domain-containing protein [Acidimicrobiales bacterium]